MMDKKQGVPKSKGLPTIGGTEKAKSEKFVRQIMNYLDPVLQNILTAIDGIEHRLNVVEEVRQLFPNKVEVVIKHEKPDRTIALAGGDEERAKEENEAEKEKK